VVEYTPAEDNAINIQTWDFSWPGKRH